MELVIDEKKYTFKEYLTGREENNSNIMRYLSSLMGDGIDETKFAKLMFEDGFNQATLKITEYMLLDPKLTADQILDLPSATLLRMKLECLRKYAQSLEALKQMAVPKKALTCNPLSTDVFISSETKLNLPANGLDL